MYLNKIEMVSVAFFFGLERQRKTKKKSNTYHLKVPSVLVSEADQHRRNRLFLCEAQKKNPVQTRSVWREKCYVCANISYIYVRYYWWEGDPTGMVKGTFVQDSFLEEYSVSFYPIEVASKSFERSFGWKQLLVVLRNWYIQFTYTKHIFFVSSKISCIYINFLPRRGK